MNKDFAFKKDINVFNEDCLNFMRCMPDEMAKEKIRNENEGKTLNDAFCGEQIAQCLQAISAEDE